MKLDCSSYHLIFLLFILQAGFDVQEKVFGLLKVKLDNLDATSYENFHKLDLLYYFFFGLSTLLFWRLPWSIGFRKVAIASLTLRALLYFCCLISPTDSFIGFSIFQWSLQGFLQGFIQAPLTGLILQQFRNTEERFTEFRWTVFTFFVGLVSSVMAFVSAPNVADETLCSTLITVGLLVVNILNYVFCFFPYEQVEIGMGTLRNEKEGAIHSGTLVRTTLASLGDRLREMKQFIMDRQIFSVCFALATVQCVRHYMFFKLPLELYYRVLFPAPPFQLLYLGGAALFEVIGILGCIVLFFIRSRAPFFRNIESPFALAFFVTFLAAPLFTPILDDVDQIEDSFLNLGYLWLYIIGIALSYYAKIVLMGPALLRLAESRGNIPGVLAFTHGFVAMLLVAGIWLTDLFNIDGLKERCIPYAVIGGVFALAFFLLELCRRPAVLVSSGTYRPLLANTADP